MKQDVPFEKVLLIERIRTVLRENRRTAPPPPGVGGENREVVDWEIIDFVLDTESAPFVKEIADRATEEG